MPLIETTYSCGHDGFLTLEGNQRKRDEKRSWAINEGICPECYREQKRKEKLAVVPYSLPAIDTGTERQNAFAEDIRARIWEEYSRFVGEHKELAKNIRLQPGEYAESRLREGEGEDYVFFRRLFAISDHRFWLDKAKDASLRDLGRAYVRGELELPGGEE